MRLLIQSPNLVKWLKFWWQDTRAAVLAKSVTREDRMSSSNGLEFGIIFARENFQCPRAIFIEGSTYLANDAME